MQAAAVVQPAETAQLIRSAQTVQAVQIAQWAQRLLLLLFQTAAQRAAAQVPTPATPTLPAGAPAAVLAVAGTVPAQALLAQYVRAE